MKYTKHDNHDLILDPWNKIHLKPSQYVFTTKHIYSINEQSWKPMEMSIGILELKIICPMSILIFNPFYIYIID